MSLCTVRKEVWSGMGVTRLPRTERCEGVDEPDF